MLKAIALLALVAVALAHPTFSQYKAQYRKNYSVVEEKLRAFIYQSNIELIEAHNAEGHSYTLGVNEYADMLHTEFRTLYLAKTQDHSAKLASASASSVNVADLPASGQLKLYRTVCFDSGTPLSPFVTFSSMMTHLSF